MSARRSEAALVSVVHLAGAVISFLLFGYLVVAMLKPEKF